ncbi:hypothetical protein ACFL2T_03785 [Elusimicrobiota bacterium]
MTRYFLAVPAALLLSVGCAPAFKYMPGPPATGQPALKSEIFFEGFEDKTTEPPPMNCPASCCDTYNLAKAGSKCMLMPHLEPHILGHALMQELSGSGLFGPVSYIYPGEKPDRPGFLVRAILHRVLLSSARQTRLQPKLRLEFALDVSRMPGEHPVFTQRYETDCGLTMGGAFAAFGASIQSCLGKIYGSATRDIAQRLQRE